jgi:type I restriction enzyme S subunit
MGKPMATSQDFVNWVCSERLRSMYLHYILVSEQESIRRFAVGSVHPTVYYPEAKAFYVCIPEPEEQDAILSVLCALDEKITVNNRIADTARDLAQAYFRSAQESADVDDVEIASVVEFLNRGVAPRYTEDHLQLRVLNQKCIRDGRVNLAPSRWTLSNKVSDDKMLRVHDVLVNSTGMGTLGRVARWTNPGAATVDSHVTIVRFDQAKTDPVCAGFALLDAELEIEALGQGSTGQTELNRTQLSGLRITVPSRESAAKLRPILDALESRGDSALKESLSLAQLRDTLLPKLMSGELRVRDAEKVVEDVT